MTFRPFAQRPTRRPRRTLFRRHQAEWRRSLIAESLESRSLLAGDLAHNVDLATDVNGDGMTSPIDALYIINHLNMAATSKLAAMPGNLFPDVNDDASLSPMDALLVINELNAEGEDGDLVSIRLAVTNSEGTPLTTLDVGQQFQLRGFVKDLTTRTDAGVFAAYMDVNYDSTKVSVNGNITYSPTYSNGKAGNTATAGLIDEVGAFDGLSPLGTDELLLFTLPMQTTAAGSVTFTPSAADILPLHDVLLFGVPAGEADSKVAPERIDFIPVTVQVGNVVQVPVAVADTYAAVSGQQLSVSTVNGVLANDTNPAGGTLTAVVGTTTTNGVLNLAANGSFTYLPNAGFTGADTFTYTARANGQTSAPATVTINVSAGNQAPVGVPDTYNVNEDATLTSSVSVLANDTDANGNTLTAALVAGPTHGTLTLQTNGQFTYKPTTNYNGTDSFTYRASDGTLTSQVTTVTINVASVNDVPIAILDSYLMNTGETLQVNQASGVLANDTDVDGDTLTAEIVTSPANGTLTLNANGSFVYEPNALFSGQDAFAYRVSDGTSTSANATVVIFVEPNDSLVRFRLETTDTSGAPITTINAGESFVLSAYVQDISDVPRDGVFAAYLDVLYPVNLISVNGNFVYGESYPNGKSGNTTTAGLLDEVGAFDGVNPLGDAERLVFSITLRADAAGAATFTSNEADASPARDVLLFNDGNPVPPGQIIYGTTTLTINAVENPPVAVADAYSVDEDGVLTINAPGVLANDTNPAGGTLGATLVNQPANGTLTFNADGSFTYTPDDNFNGVDTFTYRATRGTLVSAPATVTITVRSVDDVPVAVNDNYLIESAGTLVVSAANGVLANDSDGDGQTLTATLVDGPSNGVLDLNDDGSFTYTPNVGFSGQDTFTYRAVANGVSSNLATVTIASGDLTPSSLSGFVFSDVDNDGVMDANEARYGNIRITLRGTDVLGRDVSLETRTSSNGSYVFADLTQGEYTLTEFQPMYLIDGKDMHGGEQSLRNDRFEITLGPGVAGANYNFGERGLMPQFIRDPYFFSSRTSHGMLAVMNGAGDLDWYCLDQGWNEFETVDVELGSGGTTAVVEVEDAAGQTDSAIVALAGNRDIRLAGTAGQGYLLRMNGDPIAYGLDPEAVDQLIAEGEL